jgi:hypothetical protein
VQRRIRVAHVSVYRRVWRFTPLLAALEFLADCGLLVPQLPGRGWS